MAIAKKQKVFVGLSGGVDSATSAALLLKDGYDVVGAFITITVEGYPCTAGADRLDAMRAAAHLKIPFVEIDLSKEYQKRVFKESIKEFERGRTPNPDTLCNREIKFGLFYEWAIAQGANMVATGHYAQIKEGELYAGADENKDQSYFLWAVPQGVLQHVLFPIGHMHKNDVRKLAAAFGLPQAERKDSQGLCFLGPISVGDMLKKELNPKPGTVLNEAGEAIGTHEGALLYTMGQRHGFVLAHQGPDARPHYAIAKNLEANTITVSENKFPAGASKTKLTLVDTNWISSAAEAAEDEGLFVRYRYRQELIPATLQRTGLGRAEVVLLEPHYAPLGQSLVVYKQQQCLGGGVIQDSSVY
ncbi:MAG: tRNA 2-thiouridine(34) synthase MnmA [Candidatus Pacebacteria bacterium]|nr:tRNA 2-thiouridine(34) synthase MnmA [Candidatus Paceibacterota bacterium]